MAPRLPHATDNPPWSHASPDGVIYAQREGDTTFLAWDAAMTDRCGWTREPVGSEYVRDGRRFDVVVVDARRAAA